MSEAEARIAAAGRRAKTDAVLRELRGHISRAAERTEDVRHFYREGDHARAILLAAQAARSLGEAVGVVAGAPARVTGLASFAGEKSRMVRLAEAAAGVADRAWSDLATADSG